MLGKQPERCLRSRIEGLRQPNRLCALLPFDSGENAINPNAGIWKISKQISERYPFTINADQTEIHFTLKQNKRAFIAKGSSLRVHRRGSQGGPGSGFNLWMRASGIFHECTIPLPLRGEPTIQRFHGRQESDLSEVWQGADDQRSASDRLGTRALHRALHRARVL